MRRAFVYKFLSSNVVLEWLALTARHKFSIKMYGVSNLKVKTSTVLKVIYRSH